MQALWKKYKIYDTCLFIYLIIVYIAVAKLTVKICVGFFFFLSVVQFVTRNVVTSVLTVY